MAERHYSFLEHVMLMVQCYDHEKLQMYSKIMSKW